MARFWLAVLGFCGEMAGAHHCVVRPSYIDHGKEAHGRWGNKRGQDEREDKRDAIILCHEGMRERER
jgi:hypothetical protein